MLIAVDPGTDKFGWAVSPPIRATSSIGRLVLGDAGPGPRPSWRGDFPFLVERAIERFDAEDSNVFGFRHRRFRHGKRPLHQEAGLRGAPG